ncbi:MAG: hypothetical protein HUU50_18415 [Candidatus Brocadiae bacterium]|nr:hypothetical protein [Candidatus Brocadiia bacterium]
MKDKNKILGKDIKLFSFPISSLGEQQSSINKKPRYFELETVSGEENLCQAMASRLLAQEKSLEALGHSRYGADILSFLGQNNSPHIEGQIKRALEQDPRIESVSVQVSKKYQEEHSRLVLQISAYPVASLEPVHWNVQFKE